MRRTIALLTAGILAAGAAGAFFWYGQHRSQVRDRAARTWACTRAPQRR